MKNFFLNFNIDQGLKRFWPALTFALIGTITAIILLDFNGSFNAFPLKILMCSWVGMLGFINFQLVKECFKLDVIKTSILAVIVLIIVGLVYWMLPSHEDLYSQSIAYRYLGIVIILHLLVSVVPFINNDNVESFWQFNRNLLALLAESVFNSLALYIGLVLALLALNFLFNIDIDGELYLKTFIAILGIFNTIYFLSRFPVNIAKLETHAPAKGYTVFSQYILIPLNIIYLIILYAYGVKILVQQSLPKGWVSNLVLWFSVLGVLAYLLNYLNTKFTANPLVHRFKKWFFFLLPAPLIMLFVAVYKRIGDYGVTEHRYIVALLGVWLFTMCLYFIVSRKDDIRIVPLSLAVFIFIGLFGPWSFEAASKKSQQKRLLKMLELKSLYNNRALQSSEKKLTPKESHVIIEKMRYLEEKGQLGFLNNYEPLLSSKDRVLTRREMVYTLKDSIHLNIGTKKIAKLLNLSYSEFYNPRNKNRYFNFNSDFQNGIIDIQEFSKAVYFQSYYQDNGNLEDKILSMKDNGKSLVFKMENYKFIVNAEEIVKRHLEESNNKQFKGFDFNVNYKDNRIDAIIYFQTLDGELKDEEIQINFANGLMVYKLTPDNE